jgi:hypothetical protein
MVICITFKLTSHEKYILVTRYKHCIGLLDEWKKKELFPKFFQGKNSKNDWYNHYIPIQRQTDL